MMTTLGFVGLGHMGGNMAACFLAAGSPPTSSSAPALASSPRPYAVRNDDRLVGGGRNSVGGAGRARRSTGAFAPPPYPLHRAPRRCPPSQRWAPICHQHHRERSLSPLRHRRSDPALAPGLPRVPL